MNKEAAAQHENILLFFHENETHAELPRHLLPDHEPAHCRGQHRDRLVTAQLVGQGRAQPLDAWHVLQRKGALEKLPAAQAAAQNEMPLQQCAGVLEELKNLVPRHAAHSNSQAPEGKAILKGGPVDGLHLGLAGFARVEVGGPLPGRLLGQGRQC